MKDGDEVAWETTPTEPRRSSVHWKRYLNESCPHGLRIVLVDGTHVRNHFDSDFSQGGNGYRYDFVPKRELWIDRQIDPEEWPFIAFHECAEVERMKKGMSYGPAHDQAKRLEDRYRKLALRRQALTQRAHGRIDKGEPPVVVERTESEITHDDPQNPKMVYRIEDDGGIGPHAGDVIPLKDADKSRPLPEKDFSKKHLSLLKKGKHLFGFESPEDAKNWFGKKHRRTLDEFGFRLRKVPASQVVRSKSGRQVMFLPHKSYKPGEGEEEDLI